MASLSWQTGDKLNLLKPLPQAPKSQKAADPEGLERVREVNLARAARMPNFTADELATRSLRRKGDAGWKRIDTVDSEIAFHGDKAERQNIRINGKPFKTATGWIPGVNWDIAFGGELKGLFDLDCANTFEFAGHEELRGRKVAVYRFRAPMDGCFGPLVLGYQQYKGAHMGRVLVDETDGNVVQTEMRLSGVPSELGGGSETIYSWDYVSIGNSSWLLPVVTDFVWMSPAGDTWRVTAQYKNHRHFEAVTAVHFDEPVSPK